MSRYIDAERIRLLMKHDRLLQGNCEYELWKQEVDRQVNALPYIELDDYVPKDFHDKTCEAMAKRHQEEIASMPDIVRCSECENLKIYNTKELYAECRKWHIRFYPFMEDTRTHGCSWGERSE